MTHDRENGLDHGNNAGSNDKRNFDGPRENPPF
jgi:hypothetical protein